jgi:transposase InsO family protein
MRTELVVDALQMALTHRQPGADVTLVHHSDQGSQPGLNRPSQQCPCGEPIGWRRRLDRPLRLFAWQAM